ncbi:unnamed protein product, partial [marine sediment metagenome]
MALARNAAAGTFRGATFGQRLIIIAVAGSVRLVLSDYVVAVAPQRLITFPAEVGLCGLR